MSTATLVNNGTIEEPYLIGVMASCMLYGISVAQAVFYYRTYPEDNRILKILVGTLTLAETAHLILVGETAHFVYVVCKLPENIQGLFHFRTTWTASFGLTVLITSMVQGFYCWRIWTFSLKVKWRIPVVTLIVASSFGQLCIGMTLTGLYNTLLALVVFCDALIAATLVRLLKTSRTGFKSSRYAVDRLVLYSINVGLITSAMSICIFVTYHTSTSSNIFSGFTAVISKIYVNSLLVTLNARNSIRNIMYAKNTNTYPLSALTIPITAGQVQVTENPVICNDSQGAGTSAKATLGSFSDEH
ncbi:hypothetical protein HYPSUDRAFT_769623 [Hypholoma sublateritium FD-334 SS-4]|uniref:DUF6534 domain-containing protein n=1 Tax=Hypholoma sublateritium (strain FD-334 SS-4) TaxID=945553 RepID=A0A0D2PLU9_HYPSF|nr:hypothetical protein HYPSUDRAFT_769623 [Hypholoma sublateritium FD-334 SS-4]